MRIIVAAANKLSSSLIVVGVRHHDKIMREQIRAAGKIKEGIKSEQGFIDNSGNFLTREDAVIIAKEAGQLNTFRRKTWPEHMLFSEDLY